MLSIPFLFIGKKMSPYTTYSNYTENYKKKYYIHQDIRNKKTIKHYSVVQTFTACINFLLSV